MLDEHIQTLRAKVDETAQREQSLVRSLGEALTSAEDDLLRHVREIAAEHGARRSLVLDELRELAVRMGTFAPRTGHQLSAHDLGDTQGVAASAAVGDWRRATSLIEEDEGVVQLLHASAR